MREARMARLGVVQLAAAPDSQACKWGSAQSWPVAADQPARLAEELLADCVIQLQLRNS